MTTRPNNSARRFRRTSPAMNAVLIILAVLGVRMILNDPRANRAEWTENQVEVAKVFDGDTFACTDGRRVRLLGVDAPEVSHPDQTAEPFSTESTEWLRQRIEHQKVRLRIGRRALDRYQRTLAWVYDREGQLVNQELLRAGAARLLPDYGLPIELEPDLRAAEAEARAASRGLWQNRSRR